MDDQFRLEWLHERDWLRFLIALSLLAMAVLCIICVVLAVIMFASGKLTAALFWLLFAVIAKPWR